MKLPTLLLLSICLSVYSSTAQTYTIPWADQQPDWVFPLWIQDATGAVDTLYFSYDGLATSTLDAEFGEVWRTINPAEFSLCWICHVDSAILSLTPGELPSGGGIGMYSPIFPITIFWDRNLFYSAALPFPDNGDAPHGLGRLQFDGEATDGCSQLLPIYMTDTTQDIGRCSYTDSIQFQSLTWISFGVLPWTPFFVGLDAPISENDLEITITDHQISIHSACSSSSAVRIIDLAGRVVLEATGSNDTPTYISDLHPGIYIVLVESACEIRTRKFIKLQGN